MPAKTEHERQLVAQTSALTRWRPQRDKSINPLTPEQTATLVDTIRGDGQ